MFFIQAMEWSSPIKASISFPHFQLSKGIPMVAQLGVQVGVNLDDNGKQTS